MLASFNKTVLAICVGSGFLLSSTVIGSAQGSSPDSSGPAPLPGTGSGTFRESGMDKSIADTSRTGDTARPAPVSRPNSDPGSPESAPESSLDKNKNAVTTSPR